MKTPHVFAGAAATAAAVLFFVLPVIASAGPTTTWTVDNGASADKCTVAKPNCATIQNAIDHSSNGDTINVNAGTYLAGFTVSGKTNLTIVGSGSGTGAGATIVEPSTLISTGVGHKYTQNMQVSVFVNNSDNLTIKGMRIEGNLQTPGVGGPDALVFWNSSSGTLQNLAVAGNYAINGDQTGQGIAVDGGTTVLAVNGTDISGFQKNGIDVEDGNCYNNGNTCPTGAGSIAVTVQNGSITGTGPTGVIAQNGIVVWNEANGAVTVSDNGTSFSNLKYTGSDTAAGVLAFGSASISKVANATFTKVQQYIDSASSGKKIDATNGNTFEGVSPATATTLQLGNIENKLNGEMETSGADPIFILPKTWIVTTQNLGVQTGIDDASNGNTVLVTPGSYSGNFTINKSIIFDGAQYGQPVSGRTFNSANESTITGASNGSGALTITAPNVTVDGFSVTNVRPAFAGIGLAVVSGGDNATIQNNIFDNVSTADTGINDTAEAVLFQGPINGGSVLNNTMENVQSKGSAKGILFGDNGKPDGSTNVTVSGNMISNITSTAKGAYGIAFGNTTNAQSGIVIKNNTITSLNGAGWVHAIGVEGNAPSIDIEGNTFSSFTSPAAIAIWFESEDTSFTSATVKGNSLAIGAGQVGVGEQLTGGTLNAEGNWWGDQTGPTDTTSTDGSIPATNPHGIGSIAAGAVQYADWCTDAGCTDFSNVTVPTPSPVSPANGAVVTTAQLSEIDWTSVTDAFPPITYNYEVSNSSSTNADGSFTSPLNIGTTGTGLTTNSRNTVGTTDGTYYWHVEAVDYLGNVSSWSVTSSVTVNNTPSVVTVAANPIADTSATFNGSVGPINADNTSFWWGTTNAGPFTAGTAPVPPAGWHHDSGLGAQSANANFNEGMTNLIPGTTYYFVAWIQSGGTWYPGTVLSFTTTGTTPTASVTTGAASSIDQTDATVNGQNGGLPADNTSFWWGTTSAGPFTAGATQVLPAGWSNDSGLGPVGANAQFNEPLSGLTPNTQYNFVAWIQSGGIWYPGQVLSFTTLSNVNITTEPATTITASDAQLNGMVGPTNASQVSFWVSTSTFSTSSPNIPANVYSTPVTNNVAASASFSDQLSLVTTNGIVTGGVNQNMPAIQPNTTYYYVAWANVGGTWFPGAELSFTTGAATAPVISNAQITTTPTTATITWDTDHNATSRVVYGTVHQNAGATNTCNSTPGNVSYECYGYSNSTDETDTPANAHGVIHHSVTVTGLTTGTPYFFRPVSQGSPEAEGGELSATPSTDPSATAQTVTVVENSTGAITLTGSVNGTDTFTFATTTSPANGTLTGTLPDLTYTPTAGYTGTDAFNFTITDTTTNVTSTPATISITVDVAAPAPAPTADDQTVMAGEGQPLNIMLTDNGVGDSFSVVSNPSNGVLSGTGANLTYTPNAGFTGSDSFTFQSNNGAPSNVATVSITVVPPPTLVLNGANPSYVQTGGSYSDLGAAIASTSPVADMSLGIQALVDGGATTSTPTIDATSAGTHTILYVATDSFGNEGTTSRSVVVLDAPTVALTSTSATSTTISDNPIAVTATFSEPVASFTSGNVNVTNGAVSNVQLSGDSKSATFNVLPASNGAITVIIPAGSIQNLAGGTNASAQEIDFTYAAATSNSSTNSGGGGGGGGNGPIAGGIGGGGGTAPTVLPFNGGAPVGQVLGASTSTVSTITPADQSCALNTPLITSYMRVGMQNDPAQVEALQQFLNAQLGLNIPVTGFFGAQTEAGVKAFQLKYAADILTPWNLTKSTGFVYLTTERWINLVNCSELNIPLPALVPFQG